jgi:nitrate reductase beta subunit
VVEALAGTGHDGEDVGNLFGAIDALRIPVEYLAELFTAGDVEPVRASLQRLAAMRTHMRAVNLGEPVDPRTAASVGLSAAEMEAMYRLLAIAKYDERYVIPGAANLDAHRLDAIATGCSLDGEGGPGMTAFDVMADKFHLVEDANAAGPPVKTGRVNLLNWDRGSTNGLFPGSPPARGTELGEPAGEAGAPVAS